MYGWYLIFGYTYVYCTNLLTDFIFNDLYSKLQMVNSMFINFCNQELMFDRLQIFHQKKNSIVFKGSQKKMEKRLVRFVFFVHELCHGAWLVTFLVEYLAKGMKAVLVHLLEHLCQFFFTISTTVIA